MPTSISASPVVLTPAGGSSGYVTGGLSTATASLVTVNPIQLLGLSPLTPCAATECRTYNGSCYINPVFGTVNVAKSSYENDLNTWFINDSLGRLYDVVLQKADLSFKTWSDVATMATSASSVTTYGTNYKYGYFSTSPPKSRYFGFQINWGNVLTIKGGGVYRVLFRTSANDRSKFPYCLASETFRLYPFNCNKANYTVKFEINSTGKVGSHLSDGNVFDICGATFYDSIRVNGRFIETNPTTSENYLEYQTGLMDLTSGEVILKYEWESKLLPEYIYKRLFVYGTLSGRMYASDYNLDNPRYDIKQISIIIKSMNMEKTKGNRQLPVVIQCEAGIQSIIKSTSCDK